MKKNVIALLLLIGCFSAATAQAFKNGDKLINLGIGLGTPFFGSGYSSTIPINPTFTFERGITDDISAGGTVSYAGSRYTYGSYKINYNAFYIGARGAYHFKVSNAKIDPYVGAGLGYVIVTVSDNAGYNGALGSSGVGYSFFAGGRYYFAGRTSVYAELGYASLSILNVGISFKLK